MTKATPAQLSSITSKKSTTRALSCHPAQLTIDLERVCDSQDQNVKQILTRLNQCPFPMDTNVHTILQTLQQLRIGVGVYLFAQHGTGRA